MPNDAAKRSVLEDRDEYTAEGVFWIPEGHRWDDLRKAAKQPDIGKRVDDAMEAIERENPTLKGVLPKNYTRRELSAETIGGLIDIFSRQDLAAAEALALLSGRARAVAMCSVSRSRWAATVSLRL